jgi:hypothetical protein
MKNTKLIAILTLLIFVFGIGIAGAQSVADAARAARKKKPESAATIHHYDNDNLPANDGSVSVVGPPPASISQPPADDKAVHPDPAAAAAERQKAADEWKTRLDQQKAKIDFLNHELDIYQRELRLRAAAVYSDPAARGRNAAEWDKADAQYKADIEAKQKAIEDARREMDQMQESARKAGLKEQDNDSSPSNKK